MTAIGELDAGMEPTAQPGVGPWPPAPDPLPSPVADTHCHMDMQLERDRGGSPLDVATALGSAARVGVSRVVQIGCDVAGSRWSVELADRHEQVVAGVALHPNEAPRLAARGELEASLDAIEHLAASSDRVRAIGETGLDHYRTSADGREPQEASFRRHIALAKRLDKALVIHDRDAHDDVVRVLLDEGPPERVVFHCFSGGVDLARTCADHGWAMSFAGTVTFKNAEPVRQALLAVPLDLVLVETDAPFLAPHPHRGMPNASYLIPCTVRTMAQVRGISLLDLCSAIDATTTRMFGVW